MTTNVKKVYVELVNFLQENENKKVSTLLPQILEMVESKSTASTTLYDEEGNLVAIYCYYHKKWELVEHIPYGSKKNTKTGLNTMCKEGVSNWTKQQRIAKQEKAELLEKLANGEVDPSNLNDELDRIEEERQVVYPISDDLAIYSYDECPSLGSHDEYTS